jgi:Uma2 family endonuclease
MATTATVPEAAVGSGCGFRPHHPTVDRYYRMIEAGVFGEDEPIFLWRGRLVEKMTTGRPHTLAVLALSERLRVLIPQGWYLEPEQPMAIPDDGMPEPDLKVVRGSMNDYPDFPPTAQDVSLIVEVADSSLAADSGEVLETYVAQAIPIYWIVNLPGRRIEVFTDPTGPAEVPSYRLCQHHAPGEEVPLILDGRKLGMIPVDDVIP